MTKTNKRAEVMSALVSNYLDTKRTSGLKALANRTAAIKETWEGDQTVKLYERDKDGKIVKTHEEVIPKEDKNAFCIYGEPSEVLNLFAPEDSTHIKKSLNMHIAGNFRKYKQA